MKYSTENFCALFTRVKQIAIERGLKIDNTPLNKDFCPVAQGCLGLECSLLKTPLTRRFALGQRGSSTINPKDRFLRRLKKTAQIRGIDY